MNRSRTLFLIISVFLVILSIGSAFVNLVEDKWISEQKRIVSEIGAAQAYALQRQLDRSLSTTYALASILRQYKKIDNFDAIATDLIANSGGISNLQLAPNGVVTQVYPLEGNETAIGLDLLNNPKQKSEALTAIQSRKLTLAGPLNLVQGGRGVIGRLPVFISDENGDDHFWGFVSALIRLPGLLEASNLNQLVDQGYDYELSRRNPDTGERSVFVQSVAAALHDTIPFEIEVPNGKWLLLIAPQNGWQRLFPFWVEVSLLLLISSLATFFAHTLLEQPKILTREVALRTQELAETNEKLKNEIAIRKQAEEGLQQYREHLQEQIEEQTTELKMANKKLRNWVEELGQRNREIILLNEMGDMLQSCHTIEEAYAVLVQFAYQLFPTEVGAFYVLDKSKNLFEAVAVWGEPPTMERVFVPNACWALRRGQIHRVEGTHSRLICLHISGDRIETTARVPTQSIPSYICVPVITQGEAVGLFHLESGGEDSTKEKKSITEAKQQLVVTMARHVTLALANLNLQETLRVQSTRDPLTGLYNRRYMEESLERELRRAVRNQRTLGIILIDLDRFKQFNDTFGHAAGDALLRALGNLLQTCIRGEDIACRYGGEEFLLILPEASLEVTRQRAERLREEVKRMVIGYHDQPLGAVTLSLGVALFPDHGSTVEVLLQVADTALYQAKTNGRDQVVVGKSLRDKERSHSD